MQRGADSGRWLWWVKFALVQAIVTAVLLEVALRVFHPIPFRVRGDRIVLPVHAEYRFTTAGPRLDPVVYQKRNVLGFRGPEPPRDFASRLTVVTIGGSTTECRLLTDGKTWPDIMAARLASSVPAIWVNNAGFDAHSTYGHLVLLEQAIVPLGPKVALFLVGANDIGLTAPMPNDSKLVAEASRLRRVLMTAVDHSEVLSTALNVWRYSQAQRHGLGHAWTAIESARPLRMSDAQIEAKLYEYRPMADGFRRRLEAIVTLCLKAGITPVLVTQPALYPAVDPATGIDTANLEVSPRGSGALDWRLTEMNNDIVRDAARRHGLLLIDLARELPKDSRLFYDFVHYTNDGAVRVGEIIAGHLGPYLRERFTDEVTPAP
jgi:lysophospholipase L1-like esterase